MLSIFIIVILKIAYDNFILNSYYNHGEELIYKIEKNKMESRVYPISLASNGIPIPQKIKRYKYIAIISTEVIGEAWYTKYNIQIKNNTPSFSLIFIQLSNGAIKEIIFTNIGTDSIIET